MTEIIAEATLASQKADEASQQAREIALDPALSSAAVAAARKQMEDAAFNRDRLRAAIPKLEQKLSEIKGVEEEARRLAAYEAAKAERDKLAAELTGLYPDVVAKLIDLVARIAANDKEITRVNNAKPVYADRLRGAEAIARGIAGFNQGLVEVPRITERLRLPAFRFDKMQPYSWPPHR